MLVICTESICLGFNALLYCLVDLKDMNAWPRTGTSDHVKGGVEHNLSDLTLVTSTFKLLEGLTPVSTEDFNDPTGYVCTCDKSAVRIY